MSERHETERDRENEEAVAKLCASAWGCSFRKMSETKYGWDYALFNSKNEIKAIMEVRCRDRYSFYKMPSLKLSAYKILRGNQVGDFLNKPMIFVARWAEGIFWRPIQRGEVFDMEMWGRPDYGPMSRGDEKDFEPTCCIPHDKKWKKIDE